jgi:hypothetical protein
MANEPQRPIEKLLRHCAEKRLREISAPLELHPVNRRALQTEVARVFSNKSKASEAIGSMGWLKFWPRLAWGLGVMVVLGLAVWSLPHAGTTNQKAVELAKTETPAQPSLSAAAPGPANAAPAVEPSPPPRQTEALAFADRRDQQLAKQTEPSLAAVPPAAKDSSTSAGAGGAVALSSAPATLLDRRSVNQPALPSLPQEEKQTVRLMTRGSLMPQTLAVAPAEQTPVGGAPLTSFRVELDGDAIRVIDQDGSVYSGQVTAGPDANTVIDASAVKPKKTVSTDRLTSNTLTARTSSPKAPIRQQQTDRVFRVTGTNLSLNQQVVFRGWILPITNQPIVTLAGRSQQNSTKGTDKAVASEPSFPPFRILGKATVGSGREVIIDAAPPN